MAKPIFVLNGPNLNLTGKRSPEIYGTKTLVEIRHLCEEKARHLAYSLDFRQTNHEGDLIDWIQEAEEGAEALLLNAGGLCHTSIALRDAVSHLSIPVVEVHLSQPWSREDFRRHSYVSEVAHGIVAGFGATSYILALEAIVELVRQKK